VIDEEPREIYDRNFKTKSTKVADMTKISRIDATRTVNVANLAQLEHASCVAPDDRAPSYAAESDNM
jgi:hypothetical protein